MIHARSIITIYKRARDKRSRREKRDGVATHTVRAEAETRRAGATAAPRQDEGERGDGGDGDADGGEAAGDREEHRCSVSDLSCRSAKKSVESAAMAKLKGEDLARGRVEGVDGDGEDGR